MPLPLLKCQEKLLMNKKGLIITFIDKINKLLEDDIVDPVE